MKRIRILVGIVVLAAVGAGLWFWRSRGGTEAANCVVLYGNVDIRQAQLAFNDSERITALLVQEGDRVTNGQCLATLDTRRFQANVANRAAVADAQREVVARLVAGNRPQDIRKSKADLEVAHADAVNARLTAQRVRELRAQSVNSAQELDDAQAALNAAQARLQAAQEAYDLMVIGPRQEDIAQAGQQLAVVRAEQALIQRQIEESTLRAPVDAVVRARLLEPGDMASPQRPVFTLAITQPKWVRAYVTEPQLGRIRPGMAASVSTDSQPERRIAARIGAISSVAEFTPKTVQTAELRTSLVYEVRFMVDDPQDQLRLGMPATVHLQLPPPGQSQPERP